MMNLLFISVMGYLCPAEENGLKLNKLICIPLYYGLVCSCNLPPPHFLIRVFIYTSCVSGKCYLLGRLTRNTKKQRLTMLLSF